jgi:ADP-L-glycero-D-manno-heptose 6-epimerase
MFLVTGGAGFIGSNVVASLEEGGADVAVNDWLETGDKWRNLAKRRLADAVAPGQLMPWLEGRKLDGVIHMGAVSETRTPFIYASSAATYGDGAQGFDDDWSREALAKLRPMNLYGWSKHLFDRALAERHFRGDKLPPRWAGLKFFNVYGPNEYHKGHMMSVLAKVFDRAKAGEPVKLFKSHREGIADGEQRRDFIYVEDTVNVLRWALERSKTNGIFNVGTGKAESFRDMITEMFVALGRKANIEYIDMPEPIRGQYQYFTQANMENLRRAGYDGQFTPLTTAVSRYVTGYLNTGDRYR